ncbi:MFS transporter [Aquisalimonas lutea]|uniref:MFS transporter n=1 Tax=Aquisalimonas lutea TaxID=1327750 RepID=UPI0025B48E50|nr:MFS transporter [Aquisalimonas lutea]MDN3516153.1 MFS transporter [Aquisalimonas lutea]
MNPIARSRILLYGLPGLPLAILGIPLYVYLPPFYAEQLGVGAVGGLLLLARLWDVVTDPVVGGIGDRLRVGFGRRKTLILIGVPLLMFGVDQLFRPPAGAGGSHLLVWSFVTYLAWTLVSLPYTAWGAELSRDYDQRSSITGSREGFILAGMLLAIVLPAITLADPQQSAGTALEQLAWLLWFSLPLTILVTLVAVPEPRSPLPPVPWRQGLQLLRGNRPFFVLLIAYILNGLANALPATLFLLFARHVLQAEAQAGIMLVVYFLAGLAGIPLWLWIARRIGKHRAWALSMLWAAGIFAWVPLLGPGDAWLFVGICVLSGLSLGIDMALPASIQADLVDLDTARGGGQRTGLFFGLWGMATKLALALAVGLAYPLLGLAGFDAQASNPEGLWALSLLYGLAPIPFKLAAVWLVWWFPVDRAVQTATAAEVEDLEAARAP